MYIANCGRLPDNWTAENLLAKHASRPYNPNIANVVYLAGFIESWGRGIEKICEACKADNLPRPEFTINPSDIMVKFTATARIKCLKEKGIIERVGNNKTGHWKINI